MGSEARPVLACSGLRSQASHQLMADLEHTAGISSVTYPSISALNKAVARSEIDAGVVLPRRLQADERSGRPVRVGIAAEQANTTQQAAVSHVSSVIATYGGHVEAAQFAARFGGGFSHDFHLALSLAAVQSALIVVVGSAVFGVSWGSPPAALLLLLLWCLVSAGAGMVAGTLFHTPEQASAIGPVVGITFAMVGGCMWPLSIVSPAMRAIGHATPQAWAVDAWTSLLSGHGTITTIWRELGVLALFALGFFTIATVRSRRLLGT
jgi:ABC-2 family transporter protein